MLKPIWYVIAAAVGGLYLGVLGGLEMAKGNESHIAYQAKIEIQDEIFNRIDDYVNLDLSNESSDEIRGHEKDLIIINGIYDETMKDKK